MAIFDDINRGCHSRVGGNPVLGINLLVKFWISAFPPEAGRREDDSMNYSIKVKMGEYGTWLTGRINNGRIIIKIRVQNVVKTACFQGEKSMTKSFEPALTPAERVGRLEKLVNDLGLEISSMSMGLHAFYDQDVRVIVEFILSQAVNLQGNASDPDSKRVQDYATARSSLVTRLGKLDKKAARKPPKRYRRSRGKGERSEA
ncbi:MAG: hypothetical protein Q7S66_02395 [bacterium]|nr:hypothetical protein [bacterium]